MTTYTGTTGDDFLVSTGSGPDTLSGLDGDDILVGSAGADTLIGGNGSNIMYGGDGNDIYIVTSVTDIINENPGEGTADTVKFTGTAGQTFSLAPFEEVENIVLLGTAATKAVGNDQGNVLDGSQDTAINSLTGGLGDDTYILGAGDLIFENANEGTDTVQAAVNINLGSYANIENATLTGTTAISLTGTTGANVLIGNSANNIINDGGLGSADSMVGGAGNDTYFVNNAGDSITETSTGGTDKVVFDSALPATYVLGANIEQLQLSTLGTSTVALNGTGNSSANIITGNAGDNTLDGQGGVDTLNGGLGNDTYIVDIGGTTGDKITDTGGTDKVIFTSTTAGQTYVLGSGLEQLQLSTSASDTTNLNGTGNTAANVITGNAGNNILHDGGVLVGGGADSLIGGDGNDTYMVNNVSDVITESSSAGSGTDQVNFLSTVAGATYDMSAHAANVENLVLGTGLTSTVALNGTGNALANYIQGTAGNNVLNDGGVGGNDTMNGGAGNDTYYVNNSGDTIQDSGGTDTVIFVTHTNGDFYSIAGTQIENITLSGGFNSSATGTTGNNIMLGDAGDNTFNGNGGTDIMRGGDGNDTYIVDSTTDIVAEFNTGSSGTADTVIFNGTGLTGSTTYSLSAYVENLILGGSANLNGNGNAQNNLIEGNSGNNVLNGGSGIDTVSYVQASAGVTVDLSVTTAQVTGGAGTDTITNFENLTGSSHNDTLSGTSGNNVLDGGLGTDTVSYWNAASGVSVDLSVSTAQSTGGAGTDTLTNFEAVQGSAFSDVLTGDGTSTVVYAAAASGVAVDLANGTATGGGGFDFLSGFAGVIGSTHDDILTAAASGSVLDGNGSTTGDSLIGGAGNDVFIVYANGDSAVSGGGTDTLESSTISLDLTITSHYSGGIHHATLLGSSNLNITGDNSGDVLTGNAGDNIITGGTGNDSLEGGGDTVAGDSLLGGSGNDTYIIDTGNEHVTDTAGTDLATSSLVSIDLTHYSGVENASLTGSLNLNLTGNSGDNTLTGNLGDNTLDGGGDSSGDSLLGGAGNDTYIVHTGNEFISDSSGTDTVTSSLVSLDLTNYSGVENASVTGGGGLNLTGNSGDNILTGDNSNNVFVGGGDVSGDTFIGGGGSDTYTIATGNEHVDDTGGTGTLTSSTVSLDLTSVNYTNVENATLTSTTTGLDLTGNSNANTLIGNAAANVIDGNGGLDNLTGGAGADTFTISHAPAAGTVATITDYDNAGQGDVLDLSAILSGHYVNEGTNPLANFVSLTDDGSGNTIVAVDLTGSGVPANYVEVALVTGGTAAGLTVADAHTIDGSLLIS